MDGSILTLYIVSPDANAATLKRLRGLGTTTGLSVVAVTQVSDLPAAPSMPSVLLTTSDLFNTVHKTDDWKNIFLVCQSKQDFYDGSENIIRVNSTPDIPCDWIRLTNSLIKYILKTEQKSPWYALHHNIVSREFNLAAEFAKWAKTNKALGAGRLHQMSRIFGTIDAMHRTPKTCPTKLNISLDAAHLHVEIVAKSPDNFDTKQLVSFFSSLDFCEDITIVTQNEIKVYALFSLESTCGQQFIFEIRKPIALQIVTMEAS